MPTHPVFMVNPYRKKRVAKREYKPKRTGRRKRNYKGLPKEFAKNMRKYNTINCEKKIMTMNNYLNGPGSAGYLQDLPAAALDNSGLINSALTCVVLQTGRQLTQLNASLNSTTGQTICSAMDGFSVL